MKESLAGLFAEIGGNWLSLTSGAIYVILFGCYTSKKEAYMELISRFLQDPGQSLFIFGPRGTGKSTWLHQQYKSPIFLDLLDPESYRIFLARPERLNEMIDAQPDRRVVIIDEIQKVPVLLDVVHQRMERNREMTFVLTGSSSRKLKRAGVDLLAGRALLKTMHPFMAAELGKKFDFEYALKYGLLPVCWGRKSPKDALNAYVSLYLKEEIQSEGLVRKVGDFSRFLESISFSHGSVLNTSEIARDCQVERKTVEGYISILEDLLLAFRLPIFKKRAKRRLSQHPKFYYFDAGVYRTLRPSGPLDRVEEIAGAALEGLVAQHLRAFSGYQKDRYDLSYWRTKSGVEVDFVLYGPKDIYALEVKHTQTIRSSDLKGLKAFKEEYPDAKLLYLYRGKTRLKKNDILCLPCEEFLSRLHPEKSLDSSF